MSSTYFVVVLLVSAGAFLSWTARVDPSSIDLRAFELWLAASAAVCFGVAAGLFYWLLDVPLVWP